MKRRSFLKAAATLGAALWVPRSPTDRGLDAWGPAPAGAADLDTLPPVTADDWVSEPRTSAAGAAEYVSEPHRTAQPFNAVAIHWLTPPDAPEAPLGVYLRTSVDGEAWGPWWRQGVFAEQNGERFGKLIDLPRQHGWVQYALRGEAGPTSAGAGAALPAVPRVTVTSISSTPFDVPAPVPAGGRLAASYPIWGIPFDDGVALPWPTPAFVPRAAWGATLPPPSDPGYWPPEYDPFRFITVHHTATSNTPPDPPAVIRAIHYYHTYTLGWGDVGYNFLIDPYGTIYGGRGGGDDVVAGHVYNYNRFNLGVALLGQFQPGAEDVPYAAGTPTPAALASLVRVAAWGARRHGIDPETIGEYPLTDRWRGPFHHVSGHRDFHDGQHAIFPGGKPLSTECPGDNLYRLLPDLRDDVRDAMRQVQPGRLSGVVQAFSAYETYLPGSVQGEFGYGPAGGGPPRISFRLAARSLDAHENVESTASNAPGSTFSFDDQESGMRFIADRVRYVGTWERGVARGAFIRGSGVTDASVRADFSLSLTDGIAEGPAGRQDAALGQTARLWFTSGPGYQTQGSLRWGRFVVRVG